MNQASKVRSHSPNNQEKAKTRARRSCISCRIRKVKCDQVKPCQACCQRGQPEQCRYTVTDEVLDYITQSKEIERLRAENESLKKRLADTVKDDGIPENAPPDAAAKQNKSSRAQKELEVIDTSRRETRISVRSRRAIKSKSHESPHTGDSGSTKEQGYKKKAPDFSSLASASSMVKGPVTGAFLERFLDDFAPGQTGATDVTRAMAEMRISSTLLHDAFEATSTVYFGRSIGDQRIESTGMRIYATLLGTLQRSLYHPDESRSREVLSTVILLMIFEAVQRTSQSSMINHCLGILKLLEHRGPHLHILGVEHRVFTDFRIYWTYVALIQRKPTFLADEKWKIIPWSARASIKTYEHYLLDVVVNIPAYLAQSDRFIDLLKAGPIPDSAELMYLQATLGPWVTDLYRQLQDWKETWVDSGLTGQISEVSNLGSDQFPIFRCREPGTMAMVIPNRLAYSNLTFAYIMCTYYAANLILAAADVRPEGGVPVHEQYTFACNICRSTEFFVRSAQGQMAMRISVPLRIAYENLPYGGVERQYVEEVFQLLGEQYRMKLFTSLMPEFSGKKKLFQ